MSQHAILLSWFLKANLEKQGVFKLVEQNNFLEAYEIIKDFLTNNIFILFNIHYFEEYKELLKCKKLKPQEKSNVINSK